MNELNVLTHFHTEYSKNDSAAFVEDMVKRAYELGVKAMAISEHGNLASVEKFLDCCNQYKIKAIPGVEAYYEEDESQFRRSHLILYPRNIDGYHQIAKAVTASNERLYYGFPRMNMEILSKYFGAGTKGYGNVVATSACMSGILGKIVLYNDDLIKKMEKMITKYQEKLGIKEISVFLKEYEKKEMDIISLQKELKNMQEERMSLKKVASRKFTATKNRIDRMNYSEIKTKMQEKLESDMKASEEALENLKKIEERMKEKKQILKNLRSSFKNYKDRKKILNEYVEKRKEFERNILSKDEIEAAIDKKIRELLSIFGKNFWIELQYHGIPEEKKVMKTLVPFAEKYHLQLIAANDAHMVSSSEKEVLAREIMMSLRNNHWNPADQYAKELYIKTDKQLKNALMNLELPEEIIDSAMNGCIKLADECNVVFKKEKHYPKFSNASDADKVLCEEAYKGFYNKIKHPTKEYKERLDKELRIIVQMGYSDYHLIEKDLLEVGRKIGKLTTAEFKYLKKHVKEMSLDEFHTYVDSHMDYIGYTIGPGRGSAAGSLVCYCLGITSIDPIKNNLLFERFLNPERMTMPDVDTDIHTEVRPLLLEYVKKKYGEHSTCCILTEGKLQMKAAIRAAGRIVSSQYYHDEKALYKLSDQIAKRVPNEAKLISDCRNELLQSFSSDKTVHKILEYASLIEGRIFNYGMHAAGVVIADNGDIRDYIPLMYNTKNKQFTSQCDMVKIEEHGLLKMDFLGLRNLDIITDTIRMIYERTGKKIDIEKMNTNDTRIYKEIFSKGDTNSVFQYESDGMKDMLRKFKPDSFEDISLLVAMYRPGPMKFIENVIDVKHGRKKITYDALELKEILNKTYGAIVYQEQVQQIFQKLAGYSLGQADLVRRAMSKKKEKTLEKERKAFVMGDSERNISGCIKNGISEQIANRLFAQMMDFAKYAFNKSHACAYAMLSYITAYLKLYYPLEYLTAVLNHTEIKDAKPIFQDIKKRNLKLLPPDINHSEGNFTIYQGQILFGFYSIPNIGKDSDIILKKRQEQPFTSFVDFYYRTQVSKKIVLNLVDVGAFDSFSTRNTIKQSFPILYDMNEKIKIKRKEISKKEATFLENSTEKAMKDLKKQKEILNLLEKQFIDFHEEYKEDDIFENLRNEYKQLNTFLSGHPMEFISADTKLSTIMPEKLNKKRLKKINVTGIVLNIKELKTKKDHKDFIIFDFEDENLRISVVCFPKVYEKYKDKIKEYEILTISCKIDEYNGEVQLYLQEIKETILNEPKLMMEMESLSTFLKLQDPISQYNVDHGCKLLVYFVKERVIKTYNHSISKTILQNSNYYIKEIGSV